MSTARASRFQFRNHVAALVTRSIVLVMMLCAVPLSAQPPGTWSPKGNLSQARTSHTATLLANGKVFMAFGAAPIPRRLERFTERTIINRARLEGELERVRARGYATAVDELELGLAAMAAPVRDADNDVVAALSISGPTTRFNAERRAEFVPLLVEQACSLSMRLGHEKAV